MTDNTTQNSGGHRYKKRNSLFERLQLLLTDGLNELDQRLIHSSKRPVKKSTTLHEGWFVFLTPQNIDVCRKFPKRETDNPWTSNQGKRTENNITPSKNANRLTPPALVLLGHPNY